MHTIPPFMACANVLAVAGFALGATGRSSRKPLLVYAAVQGSLVALMLIASAYVVWRSPYGQVWVRPRAFVVAAAASLLLSLPLLPLMASLLWRAVTGRGPG